MHVLSFCLFFFNCHRKGLQRKGGDLEVCYINETIVEEEVSDEEDSEIEEVDSLRLAEQELYDEYHYEEDYWDHIKVSISYK